MVWTWTLDSGVTILLCLTAIQSENLPVTLVLYINVVIHSKKCCLRTYIHTAINLSLYTNIIFRRQGGIRRHGPKQCHLLPHLLVLLLGFYCFLSSWLPQLVSPVPDYLSIQSSAFPLSVVRSSGFAACVFPQFSCLLLSGLFWFVVS